MRTLLVFSFCMLFALPLVAQREIKKYVHNYLNVVNTIDPDSMDFSDLEGIGRAIGDSRVVMLGEQDHGDAPTFLAKTRIIKYLHEKKDFNVLAFEDDFFALERGWGKTIEAGLDVPTFLRYNLTKLWAACGACENLLYSYIPGTLQTNSPIKVTGFDNQIYRSFSRQNLKKFVQDYLVAENVPFLKTSTYAEDFISHLDFVLTSTDLLKSQRFEAALKIIFAQLSPKKNNADFEMMVMKNLEASNKIAIGRILGNNDKQIRDEKMAENLKWLMQHRYPDEKIIVWAHSAHLAKNTGMIKGNLSIKKSMGDFFSTDELFRKYSYLMGFASREGTAGRLTLNRKFNVQQPSEKDFEGWFPDEVRYGFVDFNAFNLYHPRFSMPFPMKGIAHSHDVALWNRVFDGVFYIRDMYPCDISRDVFEKN